jgi:hypothetical protein
MGANASAPNAKGSTMDLLATRRGEIYVSEKQNEEKQRRTEGLTNEPVAHRGKSPTSKSSKNMGGTSPRPESKPESKPEAPASAPSTSAEGLCPQPVTNTRMARPPEPTSSVESSPQSAPKKKPPMPPPAEPEPATPPPQQPSPNKKSPMPMAVPTGMPMGGGPPGMPNMSELQNKLKSRGGAEAGAIETSGGGGSGRLPMMGMPNMSELQNKLKSRGGAEAGVIETSGGGGSPGIRGGGAGAAALTQSAPVGGTDALLSRAKGAQGRKPRKAKSSSVLVDGPAEVS